MCTKPHVVKMTEAVVHKMLVPHHRPYQRRRPIYDFPKHLHKQTVATTHGMVITTTMLCQYRLQYFHCQLRLTLVVAVVVSDDQNLLIDSTSLVSYVAIVSAYPLKILHRHIAEIMRTQIYQKNIK